MNIVLKSVLYFKVSYNGGEKNIDNKFYYENIDINTFLELCDMWREDNIDFKIENEKEIGSCEEKIREVLNYNSYKNLYKGELINNRNLFIKLFNNLITKLNYLGNDIGNLFLDSIDFYEGPELSKFFLRKPFFTLNYFKFRGLLVKKGISIDIIEKIEELLKNLRLEGMEYEIIYTKDKKKIMYINYDIKKLDFSIFDKINRNNKLETKFKNKNIIIDYSSPNIAKQMTIGHLRSTIIGSVLSKLFMKGGANVLQINYLGDRGEQFGKIFYVIKHLDNSIWKSIKKEFKKEPNKALFDIYIKYKELSKGKEDEAREKAKFFFEKLVQGDIILMHLWKYIRDISIKDFEVIYKRFNINFDSYEGENFAENYVEEALNYLDNKGFLYKDKYGNLKIVFKKEGSRYILVKPDNVILCIIIV